MKTMPKGNCEAIIVPEDFQYVVNFLSLQHYGGLHLISVARALETESVAAAKPLQINKPN
jgi:hypothetical protein